MLHGGGGKGSETIWLTNLEEPKGKVLQRDP